MTTSHTRKLALVLTTAAIAAAGCGGSSKPAGNPSAPAGTTAGTGTAGAGGISSSTPVSSPAFQSILARSLAASQSKNYSPAQLKKVVQCAIKKLEAQGFSTTGSLAGHASMLRQIGFECGLAAKASS